MVQFKGLILLIVVIINLNSFTTCVVNEKKSILKNEEINNKTSDTLFLSSVDYKIILFNDTILDVGITNIKTISLIKKVKYSIIQIQFLQDNLIAKGNDLFNSFVPENCNYFYPLDNGYILFINNRITFRKIL